MPRPAILEQVLRPAEYSSEVDCDGLHDGLRKEQTGNPDEEWELFTAGRCAPEYFMGVAGDIRIFLPASRFRQTAYAVDRARDTSGVALSARHVARRAEGGNLHSVSTGLYLVRRVKTGPDALQHAYELCHSRTQDKSSRLESYHATAERAIDATYHALPGRDRHWNSS